MATTKRRTTSRTTRSRTSRRPASTSQKVTKAAQGLVSDTTDTIKSRPKTTAAVAAGLVTGIAAGIAGYLAFKRSGKSWEEFSGDIADSVKDRAASAKARIKDGLEDAKSKAQDFADRRKDGVDDILSQSEISEEALTLKDTGRKTKRPVDSTIEDELKTGAISY